MKGRIKKEMKVYRIDKLINKVLGTKIDKDGKTVPGDEVKFLEFLIPET